MVQPPMALAAEQLAVVGFFVVDAVADFGA